MACPKLLVVNEHRLELSPEPMVVPGGTHGVLVSAKDCDWNIRDFCQIDVRRNPLSVYKSVDDVSIVKVTESFSIDYKSEMHPHLEGYTVGEVTLLLCSYSVPLQHWIQIVIIKEIANCIKERHKASRIETSKDFVHDVAW